MPEHEGANCLSTNKKTNSNGGIVMEIERIHEIEQAIGVNRSDADLSKKERRQVKRAYHHELVKRSALLKIAAAWVITVPVSGPRCCFS